MIELRVSQKNDWSVLVDGTKAHIGMRFADGDRMLYIARVEDAEIFNKILNHSAGDLPAQLGIDFEELYPAVSPLAELAIRNWEIPGNHVSAVVPVDYANWKAPWSIAEYYDEIRNLVASEPGSGLRVADTRHFDITRVRIYRLLEPETLLREAVNALAESIDRLHSRALQSLESQGRTDAVLAYFDFPEEVRVPCEQYLLYFVKFLKDLGVDATAELHHQVGHVLFSVTPTSGTEALDKIRQALEAYLRLPSLQGIDSVGIGVGDIQAQQLVANIQHLRGQLALASAMLQLKDATIDQQQTTIDQQRKLLTAEVLMDSFLGTEEKEEFLGGAVAITKYEGKGFEVNLAEIYRRLRALLKGGSEGP